MRLYNCLLKPYGGKSSHTTLEQFLRSNIWNKNNNIRKTATGCGGGGEGGDLHYSEVDDIEWLTSKFSQKSPTSAPSAAGENISHVLWEAAVFVRSGG